MELEKVKKEKKKERASAIEDSPVNLSQSDRTEVLCKEIKAQIVTFCRKELESHLLSKALPPLKLSYQESCC